MYAKIKYSYPVQLHIHCPNLKEWEQITHAQDATSRLWITVNLITEYYRFLEEKKTDHKTKRTVNSLRTDINKLEINVIINNGVFIIGH